MPPITIYTKSTCSFCHAAKELLRRKGADFKEISVDGDTALQAEMSRRAAGHWTVPQIFIGDEHVGGCDDLYALDRRGKLEPLLTA